MPETLPIPPCRVLIRTPLSDSCFRKYYNKENSGDSSEEVKIVERRLSVDRWEINFIQLSCGLQEQCSVWRRFEHHKGRLPPRRLQRLLSFRGRLWMFYLPLPLVPLLVFNLSCYINSKNWLIKKFGDSSDSGDKKRSKLAALRLWYPLLLEALPGYFFLPLDALCPQGIDELKDMRQICGTTTARRDNQKKEGKIDEAEAVGATLGVTKEVLAFIGNISVHPET
ncbi:hypothetical protein DVH24_025295 [Malus domestica]|uniref:Uncharacterized protein n=1 Tax=Malus domestica TaxID=3750 RepID=A0A498HND8_MALDO|nr:hypothetical protein DVH24_025295 [Malus domestica]